jgi:HD-like signal output (HDOD) protein
MSEAHQSLEEGATRRVRAALMQKVNGDEEMFALGGSIARVIELADADEPGPHDLAYFVLSDVALTQRILRLSNTVRYRTVSGTAVTTVSRAIALLGFDNVKTTALAMLLVDTLDNGAHAGSVRVELEAALCASLVGREMARCPSTRAPRKRRSARCSRTWARCWSPRTNTRATARSTSSSRCGKHTPAQASQMILGCSYDTLSAAVLAEWKIPDVIVRAQAALPPGTLKTAGSRAEWMRQVASFSLDVARLLGRNSGPEDAAATPEARALLARYGAAFEIDAAKHGAPVHERRRRHAGPDGKHEPAAAGQNPNRSRRRPARRADAGHARCRRRAEEGAWPSGKPKNARELLLAGVQDVTQLRAGGKARVNDVILAVLETLYRALGFRFATVCLKDARAGQYRARVSFGDEQARVQAGFVFPSSAPSSAQGARFVPAGDGERRRPDDLGRGQPEDPRVAAAPGTAPCCRIRRVLSCCRWWWARRSSAFSMPTARRLRPEGVPPDETAMIRALKRQVLAALAAG